MKILIVIAMALALSASPVLAQNAPDNTAAPKAPVAVSLEGMPSGAYQMDPNHASVNFMVTHFGLSHYIARFTRFDAKLNFDVQNPQKSTLEVSIDPTSIRTDYHNPEKEDFDATLGHSEQWFNAGKFPAITFTATGIERTGPNTGTLSGDLTMLGQTHPVSLDVTLNGAYTKHPMAGDAALGFSAYGTLNRSDWGLAAYVPFVSDAVKFHVEAEFHKGTTE